MGVKNVHCKNLKQFFDSDIASCETGAHQVDSTKKFAFMVYAAQKNPAKKQQYIYMVTSVLNVKKFAQIKGVSARVVNGERQINRFCYVFTEDEVKKFGLVEKAPHTNENWQKFLQQIQEQKEQAK